MPPNLCKIKSNDYFHKKLHTAQFTSNIMKITYEFLKRWYSYDFPLYNYVCCAKQFMCVLCWSAWVSKAERKQKKKQSEKEKKYGCRRGKAHEKYFLWLKNLQNKNKKFTSVDIFKCKRSILPWVWNLMSKRKSTKHAI